jgi:hypothetical protein
MYDHQEIIAQLRLLLNRDELTHADWHAVHYTLRMVIQMAKELADIKGITADEVLQQTREKAGRGE